MDKRDGKIVLVHPPATYICAPEVSATVPLGIGCLCAYLKKRGQDVSVIDLNIQMFLAAEQKYKMLWDRSSQYFWEHEDRFYGEVMPALNRIVDDAIAKILEMKPSFVGFTLYSSTRLISCHVAKKIKEKNCKIFVVFGGPECTLENARQFIETGGADAVVIGEGEETFSEIVENFTKTGKLVPCRGGVFRQKDKIVYGGERQLMKNLDALPLPDFSQFIEPYKEIMGDGLSIPISWVRGCKNKCTFCYETQLWKYPRAKSPRAICREFEEQSKKYGATNFWKNDSILALSEEQVSQVCDLIIQKKLKVYWGSMARIEEYMTYDLLKKMHAAGCTQLNYGVESGSQKIVDAMRKNFSVKTAGKVLAATKKAGIKCSIFIIYGYPGETPVDFLKTLWFLFKNRKNIDVVEISAFTIINSVIASTPEKFGISIDEYGDWHSKRFWDSFRVRRIKMQALAHYISLFYKNNKIN